MYNINNNYFNIFNKIKNIDKEILPCLVYLYPFGSTSEKDLNYINDHYYNAVFLCYDQEPIIYEYNKTFFSKSEFMLSTDARPVLQKNTFYSETYNLHLVTQVRRKIIKHSKILINTEKNSDDKEKILKEFGYIDCYYFFHGLAAVDWFRGQIYNSEIIPIKQRKLTKKFISFNRITGNSRIYRAFFISELYKRNLLNYGHISFSLTCPCHGDLKKEVVKAKSKYNINIESTKDLLTMLSTMSDDLRIDTPKNKFIDNKSFEITAVPQSIESFLHVVTETCFWDKKQHLTEKIFKPIVLKQPFVLLGCVNNLSYLKEYGFKTFDRWWDESYDTIEDPMTRLLAVCNIVEKICNLDFDTLQGMLVEMEEILEYNFNHFYSKEFTDQIWNELETNLKSALSQLPPLILLEK